VRKRLKGETVVVCVNGECEAITITGKSATKSELTEEIAEAIRRILWREGVQLDSESLKAVKEHVRRWWVGRETGVITVKGRVIWWRYIGSSQVVVIRSSI